MVLIKSCIHLDGIKSKHFGITEGIVPTSFLIFVDDSMKEIESKVSFWLHYSLTTYYLQMICWIE